MAGTLPGALSPKFVAQWMKYGQTEINMAPLDTRRFGDWAAKKYCIVKAIESYSWPGNVRELENKIKGAVIMADGKLVTAADLGLEAGDGEPESLNLREVRQRAESKAIRVALTRSYGNISKAAELLGITRPTLYDLMNKYGLTAEAYSKKSVVNAN